MLAKKGQNVPITGVEQIANASTDALFTPNRRGSQVLHPTPAEQLTDVLTAEEARETLWRHPMHLSFTSAALKTGTSTLCLERTRAGSCKEIVPNNTWTIGYTDDLLVGVWVGNVDNQPLQEDGTAVLTSLPLWRDFLTRAHNHRITKTATALSYAP